jgi:hypothetical protein
VSDTQQHTITRIMATRECRAFITGAFSRSLEVTKAEAAALECVKQTAFVAPENERRRGRSIMARELLRRGLIARGRDWRTPWSLTSDGADALHLAKAGK